LLGKAKMIDEALALYRSLPSDKTVHSVKVYNTLLTALSNCDRFEPQLACLLLLLFGCYWILSGCC
jgi:hypothetical protein